MGYSEEQKQKWSEFFQTAYKGFRPVGLNARLTAKALKIRWNDDYFWMQCAERFGFCDREPERCEIHAVEHAASNFWAMLRETPKEQK